MSSPVTLSATDLRHALMSAGVMNGAIYFNDDKYIAPSSEWLLGEFDGWFASVLDTLGLGYEVGDWDCDDFADLYSSLARVSHKKTPDRPSGYGLPVGIVHFLKSAGAAHAVVVAYTSDKGLLFIEPQVRRNVIKMTEANLRSAWLLKI